MEPPQLWLPPATCRGLASSGLRTPQRPAGTTQQSMLPRQQSLPKVCDLHVVYVSTAQNQVGICARKPGMHTSAAIPCRSGTAACASLSNTGGRCSSGTAACASLSNTGGRCSSGTAAFASLSSEGSHCRSHTAACASLSSGGGHCSGRSGSRCRCGGGARAGVLNYSRHPQVPGGDARLLERRQRAAAGEVEGGAALDQRGRARDMGRDPCHAAQPQQASHTLDEPTALSTPT